MTKKNGDFLSLPEGGLIQGKAWQLYPLGDAGIVVQFSDAISAKTHLAVQSLAACLAENPLPGMLEYVPGFTTVTIYYDPFLLSRQGAAFPYQQMAETLQQFLAKLKKYRPLASPVVEIPVCYGGKYGPDLEWVAQHNQLAPEQVVALHTGPDYLVYMIGFAPGFPYLGGLNEKIMAPRKEKPRSKVPPGSVGIAGKQTGVYPIASPGGWQLIGRTPWALFDPKRERPCLLRAGDQVRFVAITETEFENHREVNYES